jgi:hypothetical protein
MKARVLALACFALFLGRTFHKGWMIDESDFPNYYTAAVLLRHGEPLIKYYDWAWFQRQMNFAGMEEPLGTYIPQTPLTMLPLVPMAGFPAQTAKRIWLSLSLGFLVATVWLLSRITKFRFEHISLILFAGYGTLQSNFHLGQYYAFLLFLLTLAFYCLERQRPMASGILCGAAFALKLYGAPFLLYFIAKRNWRAAVGMIATTICAVALAIAIFGWTDVKYFATHIFPRAMDGEGSAAPFHTNNGTWVTLLRRVFVGEPELNPHPLWNAPWLFFFLRPLLTVAILSFAAVTVALKPTDFDRRDFAWFMIATLCVAPNLGSYAFLLFLLPILLLMKEAGSREKILLVTTYALLGFSLRSEWTWVFPKVWIILALFFAAGLPYWRGLRPRVAIVTATCVTLIAFVDAKRHLLSYEREPGRRFEQLVLGPDVLFTSSFAVSQAGIFCQAIAKGRYLLLWLHDGQSEKLAFRGEAFHPIAPAPKGPVYFELVTHATSTMMAFDPATRTATPASVENLSDARESILSPDEKWAALEAKQNGWKQVWLRNRKSGRTELLAGGRCDNSSPTWEPDSKALLFASDCQRGQGLPALYRANVGAE